MSRQFLVALAVVGSGLSGVTAQDQPVPPPKQTMQPSLGSRQAVPLRVQLTLSRFQGEKKISSAPFMLGVLSGGSGSKTSLRLGIQVPVTTTVFGGKGESTPQTSYTYRDVGTNIDCQASDLGNGQYSLAITVSDSGIHVDPSAGAAAGASGESKRILRDIPAFRSFHASFSMVLRDGQTMQYASAPDPITGEVTKIDVALALAK